MLTTENSVLLIIDIQKKLTAMLNEQKPVEQAIILAKTANIIGIDTIVTEQYPQGLGETQENLKNALPENTTYIEKTAFSAFQEPALKEALAKMGKKQIILCGIEAHICVYQTALDLLEEGYEVIIAKDACASRKKFEFKTGINLMKEAGIKISCTEIILFELLKSSKNPHFKLVQALVK